jgi:hypothetical protein
LRIAIPAGATAITVVGNSVRNIAFAQNSIHLVARAPAVPNEGDLATESFMLVDPRSGLPFEVRVYKGWRKVRYEVALAWGVKAVKPPHIITLLG